MAEDRPADGAAEESGCGRAEGRNRSGRRIERRERYFVEIQGAGDSVEEEAVLVLGNPPPARPGPVGAAILVTPMYPRNIAGAKAPPYCRASD